MAEEESIPVVKDSEGKYTHEYIHWWTAKYHRDLSDEGLQNAIDLGVDLNSLVNLKGNINDIFGNIVAPILQLNGLKPGVVTQQMLTEQRNKFVSRLENRLETCPEDNGISRQAVVQMLEDAQETDWNVNFARERWKDIQQPEVDKQPK